MSGYILALRNTHSSSVRIADIGSEFILGDDGVSCDDAITGYASQPSISTGLPGLLQPLGLR